MCRTEFVEYVSPHPGLKATQWVPAENSNVVLFRYLFPEVYQPNRCLCVALRPQKRGAFSARRNARTLSLRNLGCIQNEIASDFQESIWIKHAVDHKCRDCFGGIQRYVSPLLNSVTNIQATGLQSRKKAI